MFRSRKLSSLKKFCLIFSNNHQCNYTNTISHLRLCEYHDSHLDLVSVTIRRYSRRLRWLIVKYYIALHYVILSYIITYHIVSYHIVSYHIISYCIVLYYIILYCVVLYYLFVEWPPIRTSSISQAIFNSHLGLVYFKNAFSFFLPFFLDCFYSSCI